MTTHQASHYDLTVYAEYSQFFLGDSAFTADTGSADFWSPEAIRRRLAVAAPSLIAVGTLRYDDVPVTIDFLSSPPSPDVSGWDQIVDASIDIPTGRLIIDGPTLWHPGSSPEIDLPAGMFRVRVFYSGRVALDEDHYWIALWPDANYQPPVVVLAADDL